MYTDGESDVDALEPCAVIEVDVDDMDICVCPAVGSRGLIAAPV